MEDRRPKPDARSGAAVMMASMASLIRMHSASIAFTSKRSGTPTATTLRREPSAIFRKPRPTQGDKRPVRHRFGLLILGTGDSGIPEQTDRADRWTATCQTD